MTGQPLAGPIPWRVKTRVNRATFFGPAMTEAEAVRAALASATECKAIGDGGSFIAVPTRYGVVAWVRGRDVVSIEPVGPRWDGEDYNDRPDVVPAAPDSAPTQPDVVPADPDPVPVAATDAIARPVDVVTPPSSGTKFLRTRPQRQPRKRGQS